MSEDGTSNLTLVAKGRYGVLYKDATPDAKRAKTVRVIDMRSDTVTKPTEEMRLAMFEAVVGDDVYGDDPTVIALQEKAAQMLGKEAGLYVPSGTMGNLLCAMTHCTRRGEEVIMGEQAHMCVYEQGNLAQIGGIITRTVRNLPDGTLDLDDLKSKLKPTASDSHCAQTRLICIENTHNRMGGRVITPDYMDKVADMIRGMDIKLHVDGARIFNAAAALGVPASKLVEHADSVSVCLSKGLGAPIGSVIVGSRDFIARAHRIRKPLGGGLRQAGVLAAPGILALEKMSKRLHIDHDNAKRFANGISGLKEDGIHVDPSTVETNIVVFELNRKDMTAFDLVKKLALTSDDIEVKMSAYTDHRLRAVIHHQVTQEDVDCALDKMARILKE